MRQQSSNGLSKKKRYLQVAMNSTLEDAHAIIDILPPSDRIIIEAGTPLIKRYGMHAIRELNNMARGSAYNPSQTADIASLGQLGILGKMAQAAITANRQKISSVSAATVPYIVADMKTIDRGETEVAMCKEAGASAVIAMGSAPIETLNTFIASCDTYGVDAMIDMMNIEFPLSVLRALKHQPKVVILHRGVDEERDNRQKMLPLYEIRRIKGAYDTMIAVAGGDTPREVQSAAFNDADIVVIWKSVYARNEKTLELVEGFLKTIK